MFTNIGDARKKTLPPSAKGRGERATLFRHVHTIIYNKDDRNVASVVEELYCGKELSLGNTKRAPPPLRKRAYSYPAPRPYRGAGEVGAELRPQITIH